MRDSVEKARKVGEVAGRLRLEGEFEIAESEFRKKIVEIFCGQTEIYLSEGDIETAEKLVGEAEKIDTEARINFGLDENSFVERGNEWLAKSHFTGAKAEFQAALTLNKKSLPALLGLGEALCGLEEMDEAGAIFEQVMNTYGTPDDPDMYKQIGKSACGGKHFDLARKAFDRALKISPSDAEVYYFKAKICVDEGDFDGAVPCLVKALQLKPEYIEARVLDHEVTNILKSPEHSSLLSTAGMNRREKVKLSVPTGKPLKY